MVFIGLLALPIVFNGFVIDSSNVPVFSGIIGLLLGLAFFFIRNNIQVTIPLSASVLLFFYFLVNACSVGWSINKADAIYEALKTFLVLVGLVFFYNLFKDTTKQTKVFKLFSIGSTLAMAMSAWQFFSSGQTTGAVLGHKNLLASFLVLSLVYTLYLLWVAATKEKLLFLIIAVVTLSAIFLLRVRSTYLALLIGLCCFTISHVVYVRKINRVVVFSILGVLALVLLPLFPGFERFDLLSFKGSDSGVERIKLWQKTWALFLEHPILGVGAGNWQYLYPKFGLGDIDAVRNNGITFQRPHNDFLWILSETGLVGFLLIISLLIYTAYRYHKQQSQQVNPGTLLLFSGLVALLADAFFSLDKERPLIILYAVVLFAALLRQITVPFELQVLSRKLVLFGFSIVLCFAMLVSAFRIKGEFYTQQLLLSKNKNDLTQMSIQGRKALSVFYRSDPTSTPIASYVGYAYERMNRADSMLIYTEDAYQLAPFDYEVLNNYGMMMARAGAFEKAEELLLEAYRINPHFEVTRLNLAVINYNRHKFIEAKKWLKTIPNFEKHYPAQTKSILEQGN